jgi:LAO/AO transport system kinase
VNTNLVENLLKGEKLALSRVLTHVENSTPTGISALETLYPLTGNAYLIGITGSPGSGKSTLVNTLALHLKHNPINTSNSKIAIIAVDPTSPYSGGAMLGDRVRMRDLSGDPDIFIRSMASRGALGGLSHTTAAFAQVLDAAGYGTVIIETVGAGQAEVEIASLAHTVIVVEAPGMGDEIQAIKAGILEIADILVVNKGDNPEAQRTVNALRSMIEMAHEGGFKLPARKHLFENLQTEQKSSEQKNNLEGWIPPVVVTVASESKGIDELVNEIRNHYNFLRSSSLWDQREKATIQLEFETLLRDTLADQWASQISQAEVEKVLNDLYLRKIGPHGAVEKLLAYNSYSR